MILAILRTAAAERCTINHAANILEERTEGLTISSSTVVAAIHARNAAHGERPAGAYWDACLDAARLAEGRKP